MNFKLKRPPFYFYIILWIISLALGLQLDKKIQNLSDLFGLVVLIMPITFAYIWVLRNKIKIFKYYKKIRKKFKHVFYTIEGLVCVFIFSVIVSLISLGGYKNLKERVLFEYIVWNDKYNQCSQSNIFLSGYGEYSKYYWKANTQFIDYFQYKPYTVVKNVVNLKDNFLYNFNHCKATRYLLRAAHQNHKVAKDILATYPYDFFNFYELNDEYLFKKYINSIDEKKLYNAALVNAFANKTDDTDSENYLLSVEKRRELHKEAAEEGYLLGMQDYLWTFNKKEEKIDKSECPLILKYANHLANENSLIESASIAWSLIGKNDYLSGIIYECSDKKTDFAKAILLFKDFNDKVAKPRKTSNFVTTYPAMIYFNGWGNVYKDQELAIKLFKKNLEGSASVISKAYLTLNNLNNGKNDLKLFYEILDSAPTIYSQEKKYIICNNTKYDFKLSEVENETSQQYESRKLKFLEPIKTCLDNASRDQRIISVKSYIKSWIEYWFKNPELVKTLNLYG